MINVKQSPSEDNSEERKPPQTSSNVIRTIQFNPDKPSLWIAQIEAQFRILGVVRDFDKFYHAHQFQFSMRDMRQKWKISLFIHQYQHPSRHLKWHVLIVFLSPKKRSCNNFSMVRESVIARHNNSCVTWKHWFQESMKLYLWQNGYPLYQRTLMLC